MKRKKQERACLDRWREERLRTEQARALLNKLDSRRDPDTKKPPFGGQGALRYRRDDKTNPKQTKMNRADSIFTGGFVHHEQI